MLGLYTDDSSAPEVRPTRDIDIVFEIATMLEPAIQTQRFKMINQKLKEIIS